MRSIAIYGKGGIGKTTVASMLSVLFARDGHRVLQIGCDPKHDSSYKLVERSRVRTVMDILRADPRATLEASDLVMPGRFDVDCIETGGPEPGVGCAGRAITKMFEILDEANVLDGRYDVVIYDVLGDVVCGGFAAPLRRGYAKEVYIVLSGEIMAMYAANNICRAIVNNRRRGTALGGLIGNLRGVPEEERLLKALAHALEAPLLPSIPRDNLIQEAERRSRTLLEHAPTSPSMARYDELYRAISTISEADLRIPSPLDDADFNRLIWDTNAPSSSA